MRERERERDGVVLQQLAWQPIKYRYEINQDHLSMLFVFQKLSMAYYYDFQKPRILLYDDATIMITHKTLIFP